MEKSKEYFMSVAIKEALKSQKLGDIPVGAVIVCNNKIIAKAYNKKERKQVATYHAEILAIEKACKKLKSFRLTNCDIFVTKEPCIMCLGAILSARIKSLYYGAEDLNFKVLDKINNFEFNHKLQSIEQVLKEKNEQLISGFFKKLRENKNAQNKNRN